MELDEFKELWKSQTEQDLRKNEITTEKINTIIMKTTDTLLTITKTSAYWYKFTKTYLYVFIGIIAFSILLNLIFPNKFPAFEEVIIYDFVLLAVMLLSLFTYNYQRKIFELPDHDNLALSLKSCIKRFNTYYSIMMSVWTPITVAILFMAINLLSHAFKIEVSLNTNLLICGITTFIAFTAGHIYYKLTYFKWIKSLKNNLKELEETETATK